MNVNIYTRPKGRVENIEINNVYDEDKIWFEENGVIVSMEDIGDQFAIYGDIGLVNEEGEPNEVLVLSGDMNCQDSLKKLREKCEEKLQEKSV